MENYYKKVEEYFKKKGISEEDAVFEIVDFLQCDSETILEFAIGSLVVDDVKDLYEWLQKKEKIEIKSESKLKPCSICKHRKEKQDLFLLDNKYYCEYCLIEALATKGIIGLEQTDEGRIVLY